KHRARVEARRWRMALRHEPPTLERNSFRLFGDDRESALCSVKRGIVTEGKSFPPIRQGLRRLKSLIIPLRHGRSRRPTDFPVSLGCKTDRGDVVQNFVEKVPQTKTQTKRKF
ncbi:MAG: hypothetical protein WBD71_00445, partial [Xanthobacteraceae bacterium]